MTQDHEELNPVVLERRLTTIELTLVRVTGENTTALLGVKETLERLTSQVDLANHRTATNEASIAELGTRVANEVTLAREEFAKVRSAASRVAETEATRTAAYAAGQQSVAMRLPVRGMALWLGIAVAAVTLVEAVLMNWK